MCHYPPICKTKNLYKLGYVMCGSTASKMSVASRAQGGRY